MTEILTPDKNANQKKKTKKREKKIEHENRKMWRDKKNVFEMFCTKATNCYSVYTFFRYVSNKRK